LDDCVLLGLRGAPGWACLRRGGLRALRLQGQGVLCTRKGGLPAGAFVGEFTGELYSPWRWFERADVAKKRSAHPGLADMHYVQLERPAADAAGYDVLFIEVRRSQRRRPAPLPGGRAPYRRSLAKAGAQKAGSHFSGGRFKKACRGGWKAAVASISALLGARAQAASKGALASRMCHSCSPNCRAVPLLVGGRLAVAVITTRQIRCARARLLRRVKPAAYVVQPGAPRGARHFPCSHGVFGAVADRQTDRQNAMYMGCERPSGFSAHR
jgi:hypothetical protein